MMAVHIVLGAPKQEEIKPLLAESSGLVIGVDRGAIFAVEETIHVDIAIGDFDSITIEEKELLNSKTDKILSYPANKDDTDTEIALLYVLEKYPDAKVFIYNWYGGRVDHLYSLLMLALQKRFEPIVSNVRFISRKNDIAFYTPGEHTIHKKNQMNYLSYVLLTQVKKLTLEDVKYSLLKEDFNHPQALISNEFLSKKARFSFVEGIIA